MNEQVVSKPTLYVVDDAQLRRLARMIAEEVDALRRKDDKARQRDKRRMRRVSPDEMLDEMNVRF